MSDQFICYQGEKILNKDELSLKMYSSEVKVCAVISSSWMLSGFQSDVFYGMNFVWDLD